MSVAQKSRDKSLDFCRGVAAILVMLQHSLEAGGMSIAPGSFSVNWFNFGQAGVVAFFLVSGFIIPVSLENKNGLAAFWIHRAFRIYPLYLLVLLITLAIRVLLLGNDAPSLLTVLINLTFAQEYVGHANYVGGAWTLFLELLWYLGFSLLFITGLNKQHVLVLTLAVVCCLALAVLALVSPVRIPLGRIELLFVCCVGLAFLRFRRGDITKQVFLTMTTALVTAIAIGLYVGFELRPSARNEALTATGVLLSWGGGLAIFSVIFAFRNARWVQSDKMADLGEISYSVYLLHSPIIAVLKYFGLSGAGIVLATFILTIPLAWITHKFWEWPFIQYSKRWPRARLAGHPNSTPTVIR